MSEPFEIIDPVERFLDARKSVAAGLENPRHGRQIRPNQALWLAGAAVFAISTLILVDVPPELASDTPSQHQVSSRQPGSDPLAVPAVPRAQSVHAIDPTASAARSSESQLQSQKSAPVSPVGGQQAAAVESSPSAQLKDQSSAAAEGTEAPRDPGLEGQLFKIISAVRIRNGPSASADIIGMAYAGTVTHVASRDSGWTQIVDPSSGKTGWIDSTVLSPLTPTVDMASAEGSTPAPAEDQDADAVNKPSLDQGVELPDENALPAAKAKKHGSKRHYARRGFPFRFALRFFRR
jgi:Bacterial SH3 domain